MEVYVQLMEKPLWREFDAHRNEMIITKIGRNLFPILEFTFKGLVEHQNYRIGITMEPTMLQKLKYSGGRWDAVDVMEDMVQSNEVFMVKSGRELLQRGLKLEKLKLTNSKDAVQKHDQMIRVQSMRQYIPVLNIYQDHPNGGRVHIGRFKFMETKFIAVTAYQCEKVKLLKVQKNKFAQGFRERVENPSAKRPTSTTSSHSSPDSTLSLTSSDSTTAENLGFRKMLKEEPLYPPPMAPVAPSSSSSSTGYYPFQQMQNFPAFPYHNFQASFEPAAQYWTPQTPTATPQLPYDFTAGGGYSNPYGYQWN